MGGKQYPLKWKDFRKHEENGKDTAWSDREMCRNALKPRTWTQGRKRIIHWSFLWAGDQSSLTPTETVISNHKWGRGLVEFPQWPRLKRNKRKSYKGNLEREIKACINCIKNNMRFYILAICQTAVDLTPGDFHMAWQITLDTDWVCVVFQRYQLRWGGGAPEALTCIVWREKETLIPRAQG